MQLCMKDGSDRRTNTLDLRPEQEMLAKLKSTEGRKSRYHPEMERKL